MGKHHVQYVTFVRPSFFVREELVGMPYVNREDAIHSADCFRKAGNYSARVAAINPATGTEIQDPYDQTVDDYNNHAPLI